MGGRSDVVKLLLEKGANAKVKDNNGETALEWALKGKDPGVVKLLRDRGAK
jgi:ankyrin repeat protein